jgi:FkbM family methyltransferase
VNLKAALNNLKLIERNREWLASPLPAGDKARFYPAIVTSMLRQAFGGSKMVTYLGHEFVFDNPATPLNLQIYPYEVGSRILPHLDSDPQKVLDLGANLGQFACTLAHFFPDAQIDSFEPNPEIFQLLERNAHGGIRTFNCAVGPVAGTAPFFFEPGRSGIGSFIRDNAGDPARLRMIEVPVASDIASLTGNARYDLVKIDVEGFELDVLGALDGVCTSYLFIEVSGAGRARRYSDAELLDSVRSVFGDFNVLASSPIDQRSPTYEVLFCFESPDTQGPPTSPARVL